MVFFFKDVLKTIVTHTGTRIEYAMPKVKNSIEVLSRNVAYNEPTNAMFGVLFDKAKIITFAENSPMRKLGIGQALLGYDKNAGVNTLSFWQEGQIIKSEVMQSKEDVLNIKNYLKVIRDLVKSHYKLPS